MTKFAEGYERNDKNWLLFKRDVTYRRSLCPPEVHKDIGAHPSKMNLYLAEEIVKYVSKPGEVILDCYGGAGTTLLAANNHGCMAVLVELEPHYYSILEELARQKKPSMIIQGDCRRVLPIPCDHVITSPPYGNDMFKEKGALARSTDHADSRQQELQNYGASFTNMGRLPPFIYIQQLHDVLSKLVESVRMGGTITLTHRDRTRAGQRILYAKDIIKAMMKLGMDLELWEKWKVPGAIQATYNKKQGIAVIEDEDILIFRKVTNAE